MPNSKAALAACAAAVAIAGASADGSAATLAALQDGKSIVLIDTDKKKVMSTVKLAGGGRLVGIDVRPADGVPETPSPVLTAGELIHDEAGAAFLTRWVEMVQGTAISDDDVR